MNKRKVIAAILGIIVSWLIFMTPFLIMSPQQDTDINIEVRSAYLATCKVTVDDPSDSENEWIGTGVLLNTGYVLTAAHCIDVNSDGEISENERHPILTFYGSVASVHTANTIYVGVSGEFDIAVLQLDDPPPSTITLADTKFGDRLFTIGMTRGKEPNISEGRASSHSFEHARASIAAWRGNSGGGLFTGEQQLAGIASRIAAASNTTIVTIPIPQEYGFLIITGVIETSSPLSNWLWYVDAQEIRDGLDAKKLTFIYEEPEPLSKLSIYNIYATMMLHILGVLLCVSFLRKHLFS